MSHTYTNAKVDLTTTSATTLIILLPIFLNMTDALAQASGDFKPGKRCAIGSLPGSDPMGAGNGPRRADN